LLRLLLSESVLLAGLGAIGGLLLGILTAAMLRSIRLENDMTLLFDVRVDWQVFCYTAAIALLAGLLIGLAAAARVAGKEAILALNESTRSFTGDRQRLRTALVMVQVGGSLAVLLAAGLFVRSMIGAEHADLGFDPHHVLNVTFDPHQIGYSEEQGQDFYRALLEGVRLLPEVRATSLAMAVPLGESLMEAEIRVPGYLPDKDNDRAAVYNLISPGFFRTNKIALLRGRDFSDADSPQAHRVAIINEEMARHYWPKEDALGRQFTISWKPEVRAEVVGVVKNAKLIDIEDPIRPTFYLPIAQHYTPVLSLQLRTAGDPLQSVAKVHSIVSNLASTMPVYGVRTMERATHGINGLFLYEIGAELAGALGILGLILAVVGVYGVISYNVTQRTREIGVRMALGATRVEIVRLIGRNALIIIGVSVPLGVAMALSMSTLLGDFLVGVKPYDPFTYLCVSSVLICVALLAGYFPARRAMLVNPMSALRHE
jgi:predicted permease